MRANVPLNAMLQPSKGNALFLAAFGGIAGILLRRTGRNRQLVPLRVLPQAEQIDSTTLDWGVVKNRDALARCSEFKLFTFKLVVATGSRAQQAVALSRVQASCLPTLPYPTSLRDAPLHLPGISSSSLTLP